MSNEPTPWRFPQAVLDILHEAAHKDDWLKDVEPDPCVEVIGSTYDAEQKRIATTWKFSPACAQRLVSEGLAVIKGDHIVFVGPEEMAEDWRVFDQAVAAFGAAHPVFKAAPDAEAGYADPPEGVMTPSRARAWLECYGVDAIVTLTRQGFVFEPELKPLVCTRFTVREVPK